MVNISNHEDIEKCFVTWDECSCEYDGVQKEDPIEYGKWLLIVVLHNKCKYPHIEQEHGLQVVNEPNKMDICQFRVSFAYVPNEDILIFFELRALPYNSDDVVDENRKEVDEKNRDVKNNGQVVLI